MIRDSLGDRMKKNYELRYLLTGRTPVIIRVDGKSFHTLTRGAQKPFDAVFGAAMAETALYAFKEIQTCVFAYQQSDEISFLLHNYKKLDTQPWFDNELQKLVSIAAATCSVWFYHIFGRRAIFDARAFVIPEAEVANYFVWRQKDAERNSLSMLAQAHFSAKELNQKKAADMHDMLHSKGINWNNLPASNKRGIAVKKVGEIEPSVEIQWEIPIFSQQRNYIEDLLKVEEE